MDAGCWVVVRCCCLNLVAMRPRLKVSYEIPTGALTELAYFR